MTSPRLTFYASTNRTRQQAESAREDRAYWAAQDQQPSVCSRCGEIMTDKDGAEGCEDPSCPYLGGEQ